MYVGRYDGDKEASGIGRSTEAASGGDIQAASGVDFEKKKDNTTMLKAQVADSIFGPEREGCRGWIDLASSVSCER